MRSTASWRPRPAAQSTPYRALPASAISRRARRVARSGGRTSPRYASGTESEVLKPASAIEAQLNAIAEPSASIPTSARLPLRPTTSSRISCTTGGVSFESMALAKCQPTEPGSAPPGASGAGSGPVPPGRPRRDGGGSLEHQLHRLEVLLPEQLPPAFEKAAAGVRQALDERARRGEQRGRIARREDHRLEGLGQSAPVAHHGRDAAHGRLGKHQPRPLLGLARHDEDVHCVEEVVLLRAAHVPQVLDPVVAGGGLPHPRLEGAASRNQQPPAGGGGVHCREQRRYALVRAERPDE